MINFPLTANQVKEIFFGLPWQIKIATTKILIQSPIVFHQNKTAEFEGYKLKWALAEQGKGLMINGVELLRPNLVLKQTRPGYFEYVQKDASIKLWFDPSEAVLCLFFAQSNGNGNGNGNGPQIKPTPLVPNSEALVSQHFEKALSDDLSFESIRIVYLRSSGFKFPKGSVFDLVFEYLNRTSGVIGYSELLQFLTVFEARMSGYPALLRKLRELANKEKPKATPKPEPDPLGPPLETAESLVMAFLNGLATEKYSDMNNRAEFDALISDLGRRVVLKNYPDAVQDMALRMSGISYKNLAEYCEASLSVTDYFEQFGNAGFRLKRWMDCYLNNSGKSFTTSDLRKAAIHALEDS